MSHYWSFHRKKLFEPIFSIRDQNGNLVFAQAPPVALVETFGNRDQLNTLNSGTFERPDRSERLEPLERFEPRLNDSHDWRVLTVASCRMPCWAARGRKRNRIGEKNESIFSTFPNLQRRIMADISTFPEFRKRGSCSVKFSLNIKIKDAALYLARPRSQISANEFNRRGRGARRLGGISFPPGGAYSRGA